MSDDKNDNDRERRPDFRSAPPFHTLLIWILILFVLPLGLIYMINNKSGDEKKTAEFESLLINNRIKTLTIERTPGAGKTVVKGIYIDEDGVTEHEYVAEVIQTPDLLEMIRQSGVEGWDTKTKNNMGKTLLITILPLLIIVAVLYLLFARQIRNAGKGAVQFGKSKARLNQTKQKITFSDVAGIEEAKDEVEEIIDYLKDPDKFKRLGGQIPKGVLMVGPPGTGKTLLARAIAGEADVPFFNISGSDFVEMFVGVGASRVRDMFEQGKRNAPCIIFIDEIDAVGRSRFSGYGGGHDEREQTLNALLVEMDGFEGKSGVIVMAATNRPDVLDPALLRPGRFDRQISIDLPDYKGRYAILKVHAKKVKLNEEVDLKIAARGTPGFSGADLANLINESALLAARLDKNGIDMSDIEEARDKVRWGKERRSRVIDDHEKKVTAYHEAGHALIGLHCEHATPLHKVTIIPRGNAYLGATMHLPLYDKYTQTKSELVDELTVLMGGRCAEDIIFSEITSGAFMDIKQATAISRKMVCEWGMSENVGVMNYSDNSDRFGQETASYSPETAREIDVEVRAIINSVNERAHKILTDNVDQLKKLGEQLLLNETMDVIEIKELLGMHIEDSERSQSLRPKATPVDSDDDNAAADGDGIPILVEDEEAEGKKNTDDVADDDVADDDVADDDVADDDVADDDVADDDDEAEQDTKIDPDDAVAGPLPKTAESRA
jgi:cell division protease FtsH